MRLSTPITRVVASLLFIIGGVCLTLALLLGAPSFWYIPCACALIPLGFVWWFRRPPFAAALSFGPLVAVAAMLRYLTGIWFAILAACLIVVLILALAALGNSRGWTLPLLVSLAYLAMAFCTDRLFTNKVSIKAFQMDVALDGKAPWGDVAPEWKDGPAPIVLYRRVGTSYCYTAFKSQELHELLASTSGTTTAVEYNISSDFGHERGHNVRSVDGLLLANGDRPVKDAERFGGQILSAGSDEPKCW